MRMNAGKGESYEVKVFGLLKLRQKSWSNFIQHFWVQHVERFAPCKEIWGSLRFWIQRRGFRILCQWELAFWIPIVSGILDSKAHDSRFHNQKFMDSRFHRQKLPRVWDLESLTWDEKIVLNTLIGLNEVKLCAHLNVSNTVDGRLYIIRHFYNSNLLSGNLQHNKHL